MIASLRQKTLTHLLSDDVLTCLVSFYRVIGLVITAHLLIVHEGG
jgi:hypothetical protein